MPPQRGTGLKLTVLAPNKPRVHIPSWMSCHYILKHASLNDFVWKQFRWILNMQLIQRGYYLLTKCPSAWVFFFCQANAPKKREWEMCRGFCHCLTNLSSLLDLLPPSAKQFPWIKESAENHNACVPNVGANSEDGTELTCWSGKL